jgi:hypothetical protein
MAATDDVADGQSEPLTDFERHMASLENKMRAKQASHRAPEGQQITRRSLQQD